MISASVSGFMTTLDNNAPGNYGILDVVKVLEFIQEHIRSFRGDPNQVCYLLALVCLIYL